MRRLGIIDLDTGEVIEEKLLLIGKSPKYLDKGYIKDLKERGKNK